MIDRPWAFLYIVLCVACDNTIPVGGNPAIPLDLGRTAEGAVLVEISPTVMPGQAAPALLDTGSSLSALPKTLGCDPLRPPTLAVYSTADPTRLRLIFPAFYPQCTSGSAPVVGGDLLSLFELVFARNVFPTDLCPLAAGPQAQTLSCMQLLAGEIVPTSALGDQGFAALSFRPIGGGFFRDETGRLRGYQATRIALRVCFDADPAQNRRGKDALLVLSTGVGPLLLSQTAYTRMFSDSPLGGPTTVSMPGSDAPAAAQAGPTVHRVSIVGTTLRNPERDPGPCGELLRARCLRGMPVSFCNSIAFAPEQLADASDDSSDAEPYVEFTMDVPTLVVPDELPYLASARADVQPQLADADGVMGSQILGLLEELRIDYQGVGADPIDSGPRIIARCGPQDPTCSSCARRSVGQAGAVDPNRCR